MYRQAFADQGLGAKNLSRALENGGTITSPVVPWNTCGAYMAGALGVATTALRPLRLFQPPSPCLLAGTGLYRMDRGSHRYHWAGILPTFFL
jgi:Na+:H+ antiporter, NhaC family